MIKQTYEFLKALDNGIRPQCTITISTMLNALELKFMLFHRKSDKVYGFSMMLTDEELRSVSNDVLLKNIINTVNDYFKTVTS